MVSSYISPRLGGEDDETLLAMMKLGEYLATAGNRMMVHRVVFRHEGVVFKHGGGVDLHRAGYLGAFLKCSTGACEFDMHMTIAKWDVMSWVENAVFGPHNGVPWEALKTISTEWHGTWARTFWDIDSLQDIELIKADRADEKGWRVLMFPRPQRVLAGKIRLMKCAMEQDWCLTSHNLYTALLHFSLDRWEGVLP